MRRIIAQLTRFQFNIEGISSTFPYNELALGSDKLAVIGSFGDIVFQVSHEQVRTFYDFTRSGSSRWSKHEVIGKKPVSEFSGPDLDTISFKMRFDILFGVNPKKEMDKLLVMTRNGTPGRLIVGDSVLGFYKWVCTRYSQDWKKVDGKGNVIVGEVTVTLEEYMRG